MPNPSFETYTLCPTGPGLISSVVPWFSPTTGSPDYSDTCADISTLQSVPQNFVGYQNALNNGGYVDISVYDTADTYREYIEVKLTSSLIINTKYFVTFYVSLCDTVRLAIDQIGCFFSVDTIKRQDAAPFYLIPQVSNPNFNYLSSKTNWTKISSSFIADSAYNFITIGNFKDSANTHIIYVSGGSTQPSWSASAYYIDNVCVSTDSLACNSTIGVEEFNNSDITIFPNPAADYLNIKINKPAIVNIYNSIGLKLDEQELHMGNNAINITPYANDIYFLEIKNSNGVLREKLIINH